ncbi:hypothetical protein [Agrobacterium sp. B1(2019)]|uniref:hypothetical protein n=1 Tax=Agrobacterium sp. B1(2019) TaxID=2607032 RepID=UPI0011EC46B7|nr:hypothetical protein [Agrobacterium sp. B1(2019)]TZG36574.1 hypothetical protein AGR1_03485 [Agrobacterium sp. B1(2019)]
MTRNIEILLLPKGLAPLEAIKSDVEHLRGFWQVIHSFIESVESQFEADRARKRGARRQVLDNLRNVLRSCARHYIFPETDGDWLALLKKSTWNQSARANVVSTGIVILSGMRTVCDDNMDPELTETQNQALDLIAAVLFELVDTNDIAAS